MPQDNKRTVYVCNAFSLQMLEDFPAHIRVGQISKLPTENDYHIVSAIGHQDTANVLGLPMNRINLKLHRGDTIFVAQLQGGRLPEGATKLPEGFSFKYLRVDID